jgi:hypothetical protein
VVTHRSTNLAIRSLTMGERTGSRIFFNLWPYVIVLECVMYMFYDFIYVGLVRELSMLKHK